AWARRLGSGADHRPVVVRGDLDRPAQQHRIALRVPEAEPARRADQAGVGAVEREFGERAGLVEFGDHLQALGGGRVPARHAVATLGGQIEAAVHAGGDVAAVARAHRLATGDLQAVAVPHREDRGGGALGRVVVLGLLRDDDLRLAARLRRGPVLQAAQSYALGLP